MAALTFASTQTPTGTPVRADLRAGGWARTPRQLCSIPGAQSVRFSLAVHPEDDPMEKHDHPTSRDRLGDSAAGLGAAATLTRADADAIRDQIEGVQFVAAGVHESARVVLNEKPLVHSPPWHRVGYGEHPPYVVLHVRALLQRSRVRIAATRSWCLAASSYGKLFPEGKVDPTGTTVMLWNQPFKVVGVLASTTWTSSGAVGDDEFDAVYVPLGAVHRLLNLTKLNTITVTSRSAAETTRVSKDVTTLLRTRHRIAEAAPDDFVVRTQASAALGKGINPQVARAIAGNVPGLESVTLEQLSQTLERSSRTMTALLASVASVSLLVGGIGIMNVMLLSVTERTREIGIRMALGARARDVCCSSWPSGHAQPDRRRHRRGRRPDRRRNGSPDAEMGDRRVSGRDRDCRRRGGGGRRLLRALSGTTGIAARPDRGAAVRMRTSGRWAGGAVWARPAGRASARSVQFGSLEWN